MTNFALRPLNKRFTPFYPWKVFYSENKESDYGVYHINGDIRYKSSLKLSVRDYARNTVRFHDRFDPMNNKSSFHNDHTWINELLEKEVFIFGLSLGEKETFVRNVLIQRRIYRNKKFKEKNKQSGVYLMLKMKTSGC